MAKDDEDDEFTFYNTAQAAHLLKMAAKTLEKMRVTGRGPRFRNHGRRIVYTRGDLRAWSGNGAKVRTDRRTPPGKR